MKNNFIINFFNLHDGEEEPKKVIENVVKNISFLIMSLVLAISANAQSAEQTISEDFTPSLLLVVFGILLILKYFFDTKR